MKIPRCEKYHSPQVCLLPSTTFQPSTTSSFASGLMPFITKLSCALPSLPSLPSSISKISSTTLIHSTPGYLKNRPLEHSTLDALGNLACYRMAVAAMVTGTQAPGPEELTTATVSTVLSNTPTSEVPSSAADHPLNMSAKSSPASERPATCIDDSPSLSVGPAAGSSCWTREGEVEVYCKELACPGLADTPGTGKLHHHLGLLSREKDGEELRAVYHFVKR